MGIEDYSQYYGDSRHNYHNQNSKKQIELYFPENENSNEPSNTEGRRPVQTFLRNGRIKFVSKNNKTGKREIVKSLFSEPSTDDTLRN
jgi:hypothetical protein